MKAVSARSLFLCLAALLLFPAGAPAAPKVIVITIDALDARYLDLDENGNPGGRAGHWLMPNVRRYLSESTWFKDTKDWLPSATDMNHLNAFSGGNVSQHGISQVSAVLKDWTIGEDGKPQANIVSPVVDFCRDSENRRVDTLFKAFHRKYPTSTSFCVSGKEWVAEMFMHDLSPFINYFVTGGFYQWLGLPAPPNDYRYYDPATDTNPILDSESRAQILLSALAERDGASFPPDSWVARAALKLLDVKQPDFGFILLAECDDLQHVLGSAAYPGDFERRWVPLKGLVDACTYNDNAFREGILDGMRDVDAAFGILYDGIKARPAYQDAYIVLYSDHGQITHRNMDNVLQMLGKSILDTDDGDQDTNFLRLLDEAGLLSEDEKNFIGFCPILATSIGVLYWHGADVNDRLAKAEAAEAVMENHWVYNEEAGRWEKPWVVVNQREMRDGIPGVCGPGELWHEVFGENNEPGTLLWPDLILLMNSRWQLPSLGGMARNIGVELPPRLAEWVAPVNALLGGHGSTDTQDIVMAFRGPNIAKGRILSDPTRARDFRISDIALTVKGLLGLSLHSNTVGHDRSADLKPSLINPILTQPILSNPILPRFGG